MDKEQRNALCAGAAAMAALFFAALVLLGPSIGGCDGGDKPDAAPEAPPELVQSFTLHDQYGHAMGWRWRTADGVECFNSGNALQCQWPDAK
ncbi:MAG: hypothetical protein HYS44_03455 [Candidatus Niyogibacteria bacterium]|nr:hypothetical protein [Candidatus Niyogibacteria bacterium]